MTAMTSIDRERILSCENIVFSATAKLTAK